MSKELNKQVYRGLYLGLCLLAMAFSTMALAQQQRPIETKLDRTEITRGETVTLEVRVYGQQGGVSIDLDPLREQFEIVSTRSASHLRSVNNRIESWTDYVLVLFPRELGEQEIPSLSVAGQLTRSYIINVNQPSNAGLGSGQDVYMETVLSKDSVYVQEQLLFTVRLYYTIAGIRNPNFTEVEPADTVVQMLGQPHQYEQLIDGTRYGVYEKNYVLFPQRSGELIIPDIVFRGELTDGSSNFVFRNPNMRPVTAFADGYTVEVKERPVDFAAGNTWLPATDVQISEQWSRDITRLNPGDSVRRTITVVANGLDGAALPPLQRETIDRMNVYPDQPVIERMVVDGNIVGTRIESYELVATADGSVAIPEISLPWWDVNADEPRQAVIPASFIRIMPTGTQLPVDTDTSNADAAEGTMPVGAFDDDLLDAVQTPAWILNLTAVLILLILMVMWWLWRRQQNNQVEPSPAVAARSEAYAREIAADQEKQAFNDLENSINKAGPQQIRLHLIAWGRQFFGDAGLYNLDELGQRINNQPIKTSFRQLQASLYGDAGTGDQFTADPFTAEQRSQLLSLITAERTAKLRDKQHLQQTQAYTLPPLYRN